MVICWVTDGFLWTVIFQCDTSVVWFVCPALSEILILNIVIHRSFFFFWGGMLEIRPKICVHTRYTLYYWAIPWDLFGLIFKFIFLFYLLSKMCLLGLFFTHSELGAFGAHAGWFWPTWHLSRHACVWQEEPHWRKGLHQIVCRHNCGRSVIGGRACTTEWCRPWADGPGLYKKQAEQVMEKQGRKQHPPWFLFLPFPALGSCSGVPW